MAENIVELLIDVADAIRAKKGTTDKIKAQNFAEEIRSIEGGGSEPTIELERKDVNFYDYEGTLLFSYTLAEAQALTELPTPPIHEGLVFQEWNWGLEDVKALDYPMDIGAMYITDDGKTRLYLEVEDEEGVDIRLAFQGTAMVEFGDGETNENYNGQQPIVHHYNKGNYILKLKPKTTAVVYLKCSDLGENILGGITDASALALRKVEMGSGIDIDSYAFHSMLNLKTISISSNNTSSGSNTYWGCVSLKHINWSPKNTQLNIGCMYGCLSLKSMTLSNKVATIANNTVTASGIEYLRIPKNVNLTNQIGRSEIKEFILNDATTSIPNNGFECCAKLNKVVFGKNVTSVNMNAFNGCTSLQHIEFNDSLSALSSSAFANCILLNRVVFPPNIQSIAGASFSGCSRVKIFDFRKYAGDAPPTLSSPNAFTGTTKNIVVPDDLYETWIDATNWNNVNIKPHIIRASDYIE